jgi:hypothetical protein
MDKDNNVVIGAGATEPECKTNVVADQAVYTLGHITIDTGGVLQLPDQTAQLPVAIETTGIKIKGTLQIGHPACPIGTINPATRVVLKFTGGRPTDPPCTDDQCDGDVKGIEVEAGGRLRMYGAEGVPTGAPPKGVSWTYLSAPAGDPVRYAAGSGTGSPVAENGGTTLQLADDVTQGTGSANVGAWRSGDWIAVATTSFSPFETEFVQIDSVMPTAGGGSQVTLKQALKYYHFGGPAPTPSQLCTDKDGNTKRLACGTTDSTCVTLGPCESVPSSLNFDADQATNYGVDERAEVGLVSRNIKLTAETPSPYDSSGNLIRPQPANLHWGGEIRILKDFAEVAIQGVEIEKFGKDQRGSYPIHFHMAGSAIDPGTKVNKALVNANSIHHSYNKCVTVHDSSDVSIENTVCVRAVGHLFYEEVGDETGIVFRRNLGLGAMSNSFDISAASPAERAATIKANWWAGDNLTNDPLTKAFNGYDGFLIPNEDDQKNPTRGSCAEVDASNPGGLAIKNVPYGPAQPDQACNKQTQIYYEPASGFWITNPGTQFFRNSIGGCQGVGRAYWYVPPGAGNVKFTPVGTFEYNRAHACYGGLYSGNEAGVFADTPFPRVGGDPTGKALWAEFDGFTASRIRDRAVWLRPEFYVVRNARLATNRDSAALVTAGGTDGTHPGNWALLKDSVLVGISRNNVDRFGPCPYPDQAGPGTGFQSTNKGCVDQTRRQPSEPLWGDFIERSYATPAWNFYGFMIYDGPARIFDDHFINFNRELDQYLTAEDRAFLGWYSQQKLPPKPPVCGPGIDPPCLPPGSKGFVYEGDAALGWFNANQSAYPNSQTSKGLIFTNVDLRHQVFTERVGVDLSFKDGDKNTVLVDRDGSLSGLQVVNPETKAPVPHTFPISLNNLGFLHASNSVDECLASGTQNDLFEDHPSALMTAADIATLEFEALYPPQPTPTPGGPTPPPTPVGGLGPFDQQITFTKDWIDFPTLPTPPGSDGHETMVLSGRNFLGIWEPKVMRGYGYTIKAQKGIPAFIDLGFTEAETTNLAEVPFSIRVGICYRSANGKPGSANDFVISRGRKSYGLANGEEMQLQQAKVWTDIPDCKNLDEANRRNLTGGCPATPEPVATPVPKIEDLNDQDGKPLKDVYYYDAANGLLYFNMIQDELNAHGPSPLGNCDKSPPDADCPQLTDESYYACPAAGCILYVVKVTDPQYVPGPSDCNPYPVHAQTTPPANENVLALLGSTPVIVTPVPVAGTPTALPGDFPHNVPVPTPVCEVDAPAVIPPWSQGQPATRQLASYLFITPPNGTLVFTPAATVIPNAERTQFVVKDLAIGTSYSLHAFVTGGTPCDGSFKTAGTAANPGFTDGMGCGLPASGGDTIFPALPVPTPTPTPSR